MYFTDLSQIQEELGSSKHAVRLYRNASRNLAELAKAKVLAESYVGKYHLFINKPLLGLLKE